MSRCILAIPVVFAALLPPSSVRAGLLVSFDNPHRCADTPAASALPVVSGEDEIARTREPAERPRPLGTTPTPTAAVQAEYARFVEKIIDPAVTLDVVAGRPRIVILKETPRRVQMGDERVAEYVILGPRTILIQGKRPGTTVLNLWFAPKQPAENRPAGSQIQSAGSR